MTSCVLGLIVLVAVAAGSPVNTNAGTNTRAQVLPAHNAQGSDPQKIPTIFPANVFNARTDAAALQTALRKADGIDEAAVVRILTSRSSQQRALIAHEYKTQYGKDLEKEIKNELTGKLETATIALIRTLPDYYATEMRYALEGVGTSEDNLAEILGSVNNDMLRAINEAYTARYQRSLEKDIQSDTSGILERLFVLTLQATRQHQSHLVAIDQRQVQQDVSALYHGGQHPINHDEAALTRILTQRSKPHLRAVFEEFKRVSGGKSISDALEDAFTSGTEEGFVHYVKVIDNPPKYFAKRLHASLEGVGTRDRTLTRILITRSEVDLGSIKREFAAKYSTTLADMIRDDTSGSYMELLLALQGGN